MIWWILLILVVALGMLWLMMKFQRPIIDSANQKLILEQWKHVEELSNSGQYKEAVLEADKIFEFAMKHTSFGGNTLGEKLVSAKNWFGRNTYDQIWKAHKLRNQIIHEMGTKVDHYQAVQAIKAIRQGLRELKIG